MSVFFKNLQPHEPLWWVQFEIFENLTSVNKSQIEQEKPYDYVLIKYTKKFTEELNDLKGQSKKNILKILECSQSFWRLSQIFGLSSATFSNFWKSSEVFE